MPRLTPISHKDLCKALRKFGWEGPKPRGRHLMMVLGDSWVLIPNRHRGDVSVGLVKAIIADAGISVTDWLAAL